MQETKEGIRVSIKFTHFFLSLPRNFFFFFWHAGCPSWRNFLMLHWCAKGVLSSFRLPRWCFWNLIEVTVNWLTCKAENSQTCRHPFPVYRVLAYPSLPASSLDCFTAGLEQVSAIGDDMLKGDDGVETLPASERVWKDVWRAFGWNTQTFFW